MSPHFSRVALAASLEKKKPPLPFPTVEEKAENRRKYNYIVCCTVCSPSREVLTRTLSITGMSLQQEIGGGKICPLLPNGSCDVIPGTSNLGSCDVSISNNVDFFPRDFDVLQVNTANV